MESLRPFKQYIPWENESEISEVAITKKNICHRTRASLVRLKKKDVMLWRTASCGKRARIYMGRNAVDCVYSFPVVNEITRKNEI